MLLDAVHNGLQELFIGRWVRQAFQVDIFLLAERRLTHPRGSYQIIHPGKEYSQFKRLSDISVGTRFIAGNTVVNAILSSKYNNRYVIKTHIALYTGAEFPAIDIRQHDVTDYHIHFIAR